VQTQLIARAHHADLIDCTLAMSQAQFDKAVQIVSKLPPDGPAKPSDDDRLYVSTHAL